jgi:hypothetical protein
MPLLKKKIFMERINKKKLDLIISNFDDIYKKYLEKKDEDKKSIIFTCINKYYKKCDDEGNVFISYNYSKNSGNKLTGRLICNKGIGAQFMKKVIKNTILDDKYIDIDIHRCHPQILLNLYEQYNITSPNLILYMNDVNKYHKLICNSCCITEKDSKLLINKILNGGTYEYDNLQNKPKFLIDLKNEMELNTIILLSKPDIYKKLKSDKLLSESFKKENLNKSQKNFIGHLLSNVICTIEDEILHEICYSIESFTNNKNIIKESILCFDGVMLRKEYLEKFNINDLLIKIEGNVFNKLGQKIKLKIKDTNHKIDLSSYEDNKKNYIDDDDEIYEKKYLDCSCEYIKENNYFWYDFVRDVCFPIHESEEELRICFHENINKVLFRTIKGNFYVKKINKENYFSIENKLSNEVFSFKKIKNKKETIINVDLNYLINKLGFLKYINLYDEITLKPYDIYNKNIRINNNTRNINLFNGFKARLIKKNKINYKKIKPIINAIKSIWCSNNEYNFKYVMSWFNKIFREPNKKTKSTIVLFSNEKQIGKGIIINEFLIPYVFGKEYSIQVTGLDIITSRFNSILMNKFFINCDELSSINNNSNFHSSFDVLKSRITEPTISIEIKNGINFIYPDFMNMIMTTNHNNTIKMEINDARYLVMECSSIFKGNREYFDFLLKNMNQDVADHFFSYIYYYEDVIDVRDIKLTNLKKEMILNSLPSSLKFIYKVKELKEMKIKPIEDDTINKYDWKYYILNNENGEIKSSKFYNLYKEYCREDGEKIKSSTKFSTDIRSMINKSRKTKGIFYLTDSIKKII